MVSRKLNFQKRKNKPKYGGAFQHSSREYKVNNNFILALVNKQYR